MQAVTTIGLDIAKSVFQVHGVDVTGQVVIRRQQRCNVKKALANTEPTTHGKRPCATMIQEIVHHDSIIANHPTCVDICNTIGT